MLAAPPRAAPWFMSWVIDSPIRRDAYAPEAAAAYQRGKLAVHFWPLVRRRSTVRPAPAASRDDEDDREVLHIDKRTANAGTVHRGGGWATPDAYRQEQRRPARLR